MKQISEECHERNQYVDLITCRAVLIFANTSTKSEKEINIDTGAHQLLTYRFIVHVFVNFGIDIIRVVKVGCLGIFLELTCLWFDQSKDYLQP